MPSRRGVVVFVLMFTALGVAVLLAALNLRRPSAVSAATLLVLEVPERLEEAELRFRPFSLGGFRRSRTLLHELVQGIRRATRDDRVVGLVLHIDGLDWGWAKVAEVRDAVDAFRRSGKPVYASLGGGGEREYLLASAADVIAMPPTHVLQIDGLALSTIFFRGTFDKVGIVPNFAHVGSYKSGVEGYTRTGMSAPARDAIEALLDDDFRLLVDTLAAARGLPADSVERLMDQGPFSSEAAIARGLIDTLLYDSEVDSAAIRAFPERPASLSFSRYLARVPSVKKAGNVALIVASGTIVPGRSREAPGEGPLQGSESLISALQDARQRRSIKAIVLRIDSPGGHAQSSDDVWREVERCRATKPVIASMSDYAASGGYYLAVAADSIVAQPFTITGSIGIYAGKLNLLGLYRKLGLNVETVSRGRHAEMLSPYRDFSREEADILQAQLEEFYRGFVRRVARSRHLSEAVVDSMGQGRVWSGWAARDLGLVDALGGIETALEMARVKAGLEAEPVVERFPKIELSFLERLFIGLLDEDEVSFGSLELPPVVRGWIAASQFPVGAIMALLPYSIEVR
ncbi:MAG: signal peptide peptidase SppA [Gaiellales bacterium]